MGRGDLNVSQNDQGSRGGSLADRQIEAAIVRVMKSKFGLSERAIQAIGELSGLRGIEDNGTRPKMSVVRGDFAPLLRVKAPTTKLLSAAPTAADYNALRADVNALYEAFGLIAQAIASNMANP
ncbi:hypothetical protein M0D69_14020 [Caballeronia sp. SEWSISQ10-4 2]|uniref:hypothetical protein n=1 Tax=Caballeronia sp. SEWSISQ10-4 2 TaxID=2937438 RepID=UPI00264EC9E4|nr:hypothetical protein [Caballeronia sp. SEWSISQ10-4 2]MDN7179111.1 hypothetical protein [Caballeronia sp. SEWSISQ10-4 2]